MSSKNKESFDILSALHEIEKAIENIISSEIITKLERLPESSQCAETPEVFF